MRFEARARYVRDSPDGRTDGGAKFVADMMPNGSFEDRVDDDPDFLTILNQPFAVQLDAPTLRDLRELRGSVPFAASSPLGGASVLRGFLRPGTSGPIDGRPTVAVRFQAEGPMTGALPGHGGALTGAMRMDGTAYYALETRCCSRCDATLTIDARLHDQQAGGLRAGAHHLRAFDSRVGNDRSSKRPDELDLQRVAEGLLPQLGQRREGQDGFDGNR